MSSPQSPVSKYQFDEDFQRNVVTLLLTDPAFQRRVEGLIKAEYFCTDELTFLSSCALTFHQQYLSCFTDIASLSQFLKTQPYYAKSDDATRQALDQMSADLFTANVSNAKFIEDQVATFAGYTAMTNAVIESSDYLLRHQGSRIDLIQADIGQIFEAALKVGVNERDQTLSVFNDQQIVARLRQRALQVQGMVNKTGITSGHQEIDSRLKHGGYGRKEVTLFLGGPKSGKSTRLLYAAYHAARAGYNVLIITMEVSKEIYIGRMDGCITGASVNGMEQTAAELGKFKRGIMAASNTGDWGIIEIAEFPIGCCTPSMIQRLIESYKRDGIIFDMVCPDYVDIMAADERTNSEIERSVSCMKGIRAIAQQENLAMITASQTRRSANDVELIEGSEVADDYNKIRIADVIFSINKNDDDRTDGTVREYCAENRNASSKWVITFLQNLECMRYAETVISINDPDRGGFMSISPLPARGPALPSVP